MSGSRLRFVTAAIPATLLILASGVLHAQDVQPEPDSEVVGPPQLRDFQLPGERTTPAPQEKPPVIVAPPPVAEAPEQRPQNEPAPIRGAARPVAEAATTPAKPKPADERRAAGDRLATSGPPLHTAETSADRAGPAPLAAAPDSPVNEDAVPGRSPSSPGGFPWLYLFGLLVLGGLALAAFKFLRQRAEPETEEPWIFEPSAAEALEPAMAAAETGAPRTPASALRPAIPTPAVSDSLGAAPSTATRSPPVPMEPGTARLPRATTRGSAMPRKPNEAPPPVPAATPASSGIVGIQLRPWLKLDFRPDRAAATMTEATVQFELIIQNEGNVAARNICIAACMFNAGTDQDQEIGAFFERPVDEANSARILTIPPRAAGRLRNAVTMSKDDVREITIEGRRLFIPMVAVNVVYEWGNGKRGQTSMSYLVGRKFETPSTKMGAFRLDLGPRIYRSVDHKPSEVAVLV